MSRSQSIYISFSISGKLTLVVFMITLRSTYPFQPTDLNTNNIWLLNRKVEQLLKGMGEITYIKLIKYRLILKVIYIIF